MPIQLSAERFFGRELRIEERLLQVLERTDDPSGETFVSSEALLFNSLVTQPAVGDSLAGQGIQLDRLRYVPQYPLNEASWHTGDVATQFDIWFNKYRGTRIRPTPAAKQVRESGELTVALTLQSCLQALFLDDWSAEEASRRGYASLNDASSQLLNAMRNIPKNPSRSYLESVFQGVERSLAGIRHVDPDIGEQQFIAELDNRGRIRLRPFGAFGAYQLEERPLKDGGLFVARGNILQPATIFSDLALHALETLIEINALESEFQRFFQSHPEFLHTLGGYVKTHPHLILHKDGGESLVPDFFLEEASGRLAAIMDIKRPIEEMVRRKRNRLRFRDAVNDAVAQLSNYRRWFDSESNRKEFYDLYGLQAYRPRCVVVIGRSHSFENQTERFELQEDLPSWIELNTYDDVLDRASKWKQLVRSSS